MDKLTTEQGQFNAGRLSTRLWWKFTDAGRSRAQRLETRALVTRILEGDPPNLQAAWYKGIEAGLSERTV